MKRRVAFAATFLVLSCLWLAMDFRQALTRPVLNVGDEVFEIDKGENLRRIADRLRQQGIVDKPHWLIALAYRKGVAGQVKYGEYLVRPGTTMADLLTMLVTGKVRQHSFAIIEGWTFQQLMSALDAHAAIDHRLSGKRPDEIMDALGAAGVHPEGRFFPDTYFFAKGSSDAELLRRARQRMDAALAEEWERRQPGLPLADAYQALVLASIVEKETSRADERMLVAGVFVRRLAKGMRLQADPTVIYGMGDGYHGNITRQDLLQDTPYNTYRRNGLPPTPIAMPGLAALRAVLQPAGGDALYFVGRGDGSHLFSGDLSTHERAVTAFQRSGRNESR